MYVLSEPYHLIFVGFFFGSLNVRLLLISDQRVYRWRGMCRECYHENPSLFFTNIISTTFFNTRQIQQNL